jgi:O-acetyl-ADP-ribose deacetylase (regulator of RNase III)
MISRIEEGDLLDFPHRINIAAHSCNCQNTMGAGIALQYKKRYPQVWEADCKAAKEGTNILGNFSMARIAETKWVYNMYTQLHYGNNLRFVNYEYFYRCLEAICKEAGIINHMIFPLFKPMTIGFPYLISCGRAGGSWKVIHSMIDDVFEKYPGEVIIVKPKT